MPAVLEVTRTIARTMARTAARRETPARLRLAVTVLVAVTLALLLAMSLLMARVQHQVRVIGDEAAPQAANAAELYFALSDADAQVARLVLVGDQDALAGSRIDALGAYQQRGRDIDAGLQRALTTATGAAERAVVLELLDHLAVYRQRVWQTLTAGPAAPGYYTQATNVLHLDLLPAAQRLGDLARDRLSGAYAAKRVTEIAGMTLTVLLGLVLIGSLLALQRWLARRFRRLLNPALIAATLLTAALTVPAVAVFATQASRLADARTTGLDPFLALAEARAVGYDAAADTSRALISADPGHYRADFDRKSRCLTDGDGDACGGGLRAVAGGAAADRWTVYRQDHQRILGQAGAGRRADAIVALTGIRRGDAAFDFSYFDAAVAQIAAERRDAYGAAVSDANRLLTGWPYLPVVVLGLVALLVPLSVRQRLAEYR